MLLDYKDVQAEVFVSFDFSSASTSAANPTIVVTSIGLVTDPSPGSILSGAPVINGAKVSQLVIGGLDGALYELKCLALMSDGITELPITATLPVYRA